MENQTVKLQIDEKNSSARVSVPIRLARIKGWEDKEELQWVEESGEIVLKSV